MKEDEDVYVVVVESIRLMALILWWKTSLKDTRMNDAIMIIYNVALRLLPSTSIYKMHVGVGGCEGPG